MSESAPCPPTVPATTVTFSRKCHPRRHVNDDQAKGTGMSHSRQRRRGHTHTHDSGSAIRESEGRPQGTVSGGLLQSPFDHRLAPPAELASEAWANGFDWFTFVCCSCGELTHIARDWRQDVAEFHITSVWLYGLPPECSECQEVRRHG
jgi:hypothetical protein